jgi:lipoprotein-anchoring transpeptidase ErfK/SrfK
VRNIGKILVPVVLVFGFTGPIAAAPRVAATAVNEANFSELKPKQISPAAIKAQVLLDRAGFSPGVIDGHWGENAQKAAKVFQRGNGLPETGRLDRGTWDKLTASASEPVLVDYEISRNDVKGPFVKKLPQKLEQQAELKRLSYTSPAEALAERFHMDVDLLRALNPGKDFKKAGERIAVAAVPQESRQQKVARVVVSKRDGAVSALADDGTLIAYFPATVGSDEKPAPSGMTEVRTIAENPNYTYNPDYKFKGVKSKEKFEIQPGPNNPVGVVWIGLSVDGYGIHGTPEPATVSKTASNGCVRLTNWDARALARMVSKGTPVEFVE